MKSKELRDLELKGVKNAEDALASVEGAIRLIKYGSTKKRIYISLPVIGREMSESKAQSDRHKKIWEEGSDYEVITPFDICTDPNMEYSQCMGKCIDVLLECDAIYMAPGWVDSKWCNAEFQIAKIYGKKIIA